MPYISGVYKDTADLKAYNSEETRNICLREESQGKIPILLYWAGGGHILFYADRGVSINDILTSLETTEFRAKMTKLDLCQLFVYSERNRQYESPKKLTDYSLPIEQLSKETKIQIALWYTH